MKNTGTLKINLLNDHEVQMVRVFRAPRQLVWDALFSPALLERCRKTHDDQVGARGIDPREDRLGVLTGVAARMPALHVVEAVLGASDPEAGEAGYDLFDANMLAFVKQHFIDLNDQRFTFSIESGPMKQWSRVFAEFKGK